MDTTLADWIPIFSLIWVFLFVMGLAIASRKGFNTWVAAMFLILLGPIAFLQIVVMPENIEGMKNRELRYGASKLCPYCHMTIPLFAIKCRYCSSDVPKYPKPEDYDLEPDAGPDDEPPVNSNTEVDFELSPRNRTKED